MTIIAGQSFALHIIILPAVNYHWPSCLWVRGVDSPEKIEEGRGQLRCAVVWPTSVVELQHCATITSDNLFQQTT